MACSRHSHRSNGHRISSAVMRNCERRIRQLRISPGQWPWRVISMDSSPNCRRQKTQRERLVATLGALERANVQQIDRRILGTRVNEQLQHWRTLLSTKQVQDGRQLLREVLAGPLRFTPDARTYRFEGQARLGALLAQ